MFNKPKGVIYLKRDSLSVYVPGVEKVVSTTFDSGHVRDLDIINDGELGEFIKAFLQQNSLAKTPCVMVLSEDVVFQKRFSVAKPEGLESNIKAFVDDIPFEPEKVVTKRFHAGKDILVVAVNGDFFGKFVDIFKILGWKITGVVPSLLFGQIDGLTTAKAQAIIQNKDMLKSGDLLSEPRESMREAPQEKKKKKAVETTNTDSEDEEKSEPKPGLSEKDLEGLESGPNIDIRSILPILVFVLFLAALGGLVYYFLFVKQDLSGQNDASQEQEVEQVVEVQPEEVGDTETEEEPVEEEQEPEIGIEDVDKTEFTVIVFNGTGEAGLAGDTRDIVEGLGYEGIEVGNADAYDNEETTITYIETIPDVAIDELVDTLYESFANVSAQSVLEEEIGDYDIEIIAAERLTE